MHARKDRLGHDVTHRDTHVEYIRIHTHTHRSEEDLRGMRLYIYSVSLP